MSKFILRCLLVFLICTIPLFTQSFEKIHQKKIDTLEQKTNKTKSPTLAMLFSAVLPGSGQFYNKSYWKVPIILGLAAYWGYEWKGLNNNYKNYKKLYLNSIATSPPDGFYQYRVLRDFYKNERDKFAWYLGILYIANILDAYVDASLFEFDVGDDLSNIDKLDFLNIKLKIYF